MKKINTPGHVKVVPITPSWSYDCSYCGKRQAVAEVQIPRVEEVHGYCAVCLGRAIMAEFIEVKKCDTCGRNVKTVNDDFSEHNHRYFEEHVRKSHSPKEAERILRAARRRSASK